MSAITVSDVKVTDRGKFKKVVITMEGLVTEDEALRLLKLKDKPIYERRVDIPVQSSRAPSRVE